MGRKGSVQWRKGLFFDACAGLLIDKVPTKKVEGWKDIARVKPIIYRRQTKFSAILQHPYSYPWSFNLYYDNYFIHFRESFHQAEKSTYRTSHLSCIVKGNKYTFFFEADETTWYTYTTS